MVIGGLRQHQRADPDRAAPPQGPGGSLDCCAGRRDVVDQQNPGAGQLPECAKGTANVGQAPRPGQRGLGRSVAQANEQVAVQRTVETPRDLVGQQAALVVAALSFAAGCERDGDDAVHLKVGRESREGEGSEVGGEVALVAVLEALDGLEDGRGVGVGRVKVVDAAALEAAAGALVAVGEGPGALAALGMREGRGGFQAGLAEGGAWAAAGGAAGREEGGGEGPAGGSETVDGRLGEQTKDRPALDSVERGTARHYPRSIGLAGGAGRARGGLDDGRLAVLQAKFELAALGRLLHDVVGERLIDVFAHQLRDRASAGVPTEGNGDDVVERVGGDVEADAQVFGA